MYCINFGRQLRDKFKPEKVSFALLKEIDDSNRVVKQDVEKGYMDQTIAEGSDRIYVEWQIDAI